MAIRCIKFRAFTKNTLKGFADLELTKPGLVIRDCTWHQKGDDEWIGWPARSYEKDGKTCWTPIVEFAKGADRDSFQKAAVAAVRAAAQNGQPSAAPEGQPLDDSIPF